MKIILLPFLLLSGLALHAQYYYKDIIGTKESSDLIKTYKKAGVARVNVNSYDAENTRNEDFYLTQTFSKPHAVLRTVSRDGSTNESVLTSYADSSGKVIKTLDSTAQMTSVTEYGYDNAGRLDFIKSISTDSSKRMNESELHQWQYNNGAVARMLRIVNGKDTTVVDFRIDNGNVVEEQSTRRGVKGDPVYYYYNAANQLTDIVRFNNKARRLLPEYMFEYAPDGKMIQKITVPANSSAYLIWRYQYDATGLKIKEAIYDRYKTLNGKIEYQYVRND
jgi:antitoxin component YwqK of YwqJK toxin-antitoxin module